MFLIRPFLFFCISWAGIQTLFAQNTCSVQDSAQAEVFNQYAKQAEKAARWDSSVYYYQKSKQIFETANCPRGLVKILNNLSISYQRAEQPDNARAALLQAYTLANQRLLDTDSLKGKTYQLIGMDYFQAQKSDSARFYLNKALQIYQAANAWNSYLRVVKILVQISNFQQQFEQMEQYLIQAESIISSKLQNAPEQLIPILELYGVLYYQKGDYPKALSSTKKALELAQPRARTRQDTSQLIAYYNNIGLLYTEIADMYNAEHYSNQARVLAAEIGDFYQIGVICFNIAEFYRTRTDFNRALPFYKKGLEALDKLNPNQKTNLGQIDQNNTRAYINLRNGLAKTAIKLNRNLEATNAILANMEAHAKEPYAQEETYRVQGNLFVKLGKYEEAKISFDESLRLHTKIYGSLHPLVSRVYTNMGELYQSLKQPNKALDYFKSAQESVCYAPCHGEETVPNNNNPEHLILDKERYIEALHGQANSNYEMGQIDRAFATTTDLVRLIDKVRNRIKAKTSKLFLQQRVNPIYELRLRICADKYQQSKDTAWLEEAFRISEKSKSMLLLDGLKNQEALNSGKLPKKFINETHRLEKSIAEQERKLFEAQFSQDKQAVQNIEGALIDLQKKLEQLETDLENDPQYQQYYQIKYKDKQISTAQLQAFLAPQEQLISYFVGSEHYYLISISRNHKKMLQLPKTSSTENSLLGLRAALTNTILIRDNPKAAYHLLTKNAWEVYSLFLAPVLEPNTKNLLIIPDGMLNYIPFETLLNQPIESHPTDSSYHFGKLPYLLKTHTVRYGYSAGLLFYERSSARWWGKILGFAPSYEYTPCETPECLADAAQARQRIIRNQVGDLPGAQRELEWLDKTFGGNFLYGKNANEANFKKLAQNQSYSIIHLAMHGWVDDNNPDFSNLVLSQTKDSGDGEDGLLHSYELDLMSLSADLVVLSACETGFGRYERGEGVQSLGRGFMHAGVPSLAMSLWAINDQSTAILMQHFYKHLADGKPKDEALTLAKQAYLELVDDKSGHPFFWAAIVLVGDNAPLSMWKDWYLWAMLGGVILAGSCLFYLGFRYWKKSSPQKV